jgi:hypothetical protein
MASVNMDLRVITIPKSGLATRLIHEAGFRPRSESTHAGQQGGGYDNAIF